MNLKARKKRKAGYFIFISLFFVLSNFIWSDAQSAQNSSRFGGSGGNKSYNLDCGKKGAVVGFEFRKGFFIDQVTLICQEIIDSGRLGQVYTRGPAGGMGGRQMKIMCKKGNIVQFVGLKHGSYIDHIYAECEKWIPERKIVGSSKSTFDVIGSLPSGISGQASFNCTPRNGGNFVMKSIKGKYGNVIDSMQFSCRRWDQ